MKEHLDDMSIEELKALQKNIAKAIATYEQRQKAEARKALEEHAKDLGFKLKDLVNDFPAKMSKTSAPPKYKNSKTGKTWTGRGMKPKWIKDHLDDGGSLDDLLIK
jgi:DNA-binding protein H-NS